MAKQKTTQADVIRIAAGLSDATQEIRGVIKDLEHMRIDGIDDGLLRAALSLTAVSRACGEAVSHILLAVDMAKTQRKLDAMK